MIPVSSCRRCLALGSLGLHTRTALYRTICRSGRIAMARSATRRRPVPKVIDTEKVEPHKGKYTGTQHTVLMSPSKDYGSNMHAEYSDRYRRRLGVEHLMMGIDTRGERGQMKNVYLPLVVRASFVCNVASEGNTQVGKPSMSLTTSSPQQCRR